MMMSDDLYDFYFKDLSLGRLRRQGVGVWEDWWSRKGVVGALLVIMIVLTVGLEICAVWSGSGWWLAAAYLPGVLFALNFFRPAFGRILIADSDRKVAGMKYSDYLELRLRESLRERRLMRYEAAEKLADLCQAASRPLVKGRQEAKFIFFSVVFAGAFTVVQPLAGWIGGVQDGPQAILLSTVCGWGLVVLVVWCCYRWVCLAPLDNVRRKAERLNRLSLSLRQIAYELQFQWDDEENLG